MKLAMLSQKLTVKLVALLLACSSPLIAKAKEITIPELAIIQQNTLNASIFVSDSEITAISRDDKTKVSLSLFSSGVSKLVVTYGNTNEKQEAFSGKVSAWSTIPSAFVQLFRTLKSCDEIARCSLEGDLLSQVKSLGTQIDGGNILYGDLNRDGGQILEDLYINRIHLLILAFGKDTIGIWTIGKPGFPRVNSFDATAYYLFRPL